jgi:hypothetical protein
MSRTTRSKSSAPRGENFGFGGKTVCHQGIRAALPTPRLTVPTEECGCGLSRLAAAHERDFREKAWCSDVIAGTVDAVAVCH